MLHEYAHYLQFWPWYTRYQNRYPYKLNPYEIQAKEMEKMAPLLIHLTREERWKKMLKKDEKLARIHRRVQMTIEI